MQKIYIINERELNLANLINKLQIKSLGRIKNYSYIHMACSNANVKQKIRFIDKCT